MQSSRRGIKDRIMKKLRNEITVQNNTVAGFTIHHLTIHRQKNSKKLKFYKFGAILHLAKEKGEIPTKTATIYSIKVKTNSFLHLTLSTRNLD